MVSLKDIERARSAISTHLDRTPLIYSDSLSRMSGAEVFLKCENLQRTGSFKTRGAFNKLVPFKGGKVIAASMGNHAQGVAYAASILGISAKIVMPGGVSIVKENAVRAYGAEVVLEGETLGEAVEYARGQKGYTFIHPYDDDDIIAGQGTIGLEILDELKEMDSVLVPVGGGGLVSGVSVALKSHRPGIKVIGIQTEAARSAFLSFREKTIVQDTPRSTLADGIAVGRVGERTFEVINKYVDDMATVAEASIARAILLFLERKKLVVEGAGAVALALLLEGGVRFRGQRIALVISGGNIDFTLMDKILHKGLVESGRVGVFEATLEDVPGALHMLTGIIAARRGNILHVLHDRLSEALPVGKTRVMLTVETKNSEHLKEIIAAIRSAGIEVG
jgi:threonine dehydratase